MHRAVNSWKSIKKVPSKHFKGNVNHFHFPFLLSQHCVKFFTVNFGKEVESTLGGTSNNNVSNYPLCIVYLSFHPHGHI